MFIRQFVLYITKAFPTVSTVSFNFPIVNLCLHVLECMHLLNIRMCVLITVHGASSYDVTGVQRRLESYEVIHKVNNNQHPVDSTSNNHDDEQTVYVFEFESESNEKEESLQEGKETPSGKSNHLSLWISINPL